jgi:hypothetical protein
LIRALGKIGDPCALPAIEKVARARFSLCLKRISGLRTVVFESLERYPHEHLTRILNFGIKLSDPNIKSICDRIIRTGSQTRGERSMRTTTCNSGAAENDGN